MAKIYNEIVIDMNPESPTFEETLYEDSFEYSGDMMLMQGEQYAEGAKIYLKIDTHIGQDFYGGDKEFPVWELYTYTGGRWNASGKTYNESTGDSWKHSVEHGKLEEGVEFLTEHPDKDKTLGERSIGMGDVTAEQMFGKKENEMLQWIIDTRYGGKLPDNISENDILTQIRTKLPQEEGITGTDWYGIQDTASQVTGQARSVYGGMGAGARQEIAGQKQIGKDIYALEEGKDKDWTSKFRTFLSSLPTATGTG